MKLIIKYLLIIVVCCLSGCSKYLNEKSDLTLVIPSTLVDLQSILDNSSRNIFVDLGEGEISSTDYYITDDDFNALRLEGDKRMYTWQKDHLLEKSSNSWSYLSTSIYSANSVLESLEMIERSAANKLEYDDIMGQALYLRAKNLLLLSFVFTLAYDENSASTDLGLPLRLGTDFNEISVRSSIKETYQQIITDLEKSIRLLPESSKHVVRPSKPAAYALLARTYLSMRRYEQVASYADSCLQLFNHLIDYNTLNPSLTYSFEQFNKETIIYSVIALPEPLYPHIAKIVPELYKKYAENDLRRELFFRRNADGTYSFKGSYVGSGNPSPFSGISTNEVYLMYAEALARQGKVFEAKVALNTLLVNRWKKINGESTFIPVETDLVDELVDIILQERRKELLMRGLRWMDIKRLNKEGANITLTRTVNGQEYTLPPNDLRYALPIPEDVIAISKMIQNPR